ncbi:superoxide dismutase family protein, partial [Xanthomonas oryzae pv. oryzae]
MSPNGARPLRSPESGRQWLQLRPFF